MIKMPIEEIIGKIKEKTNMSDEEIKDRIKKKMDHLAGLISEEGAAHIIANEEGIKLFEEASGRLQISNLLAGMKNVEVVGRIQDVYEVREFQKDDRTGKVGSFLIGDETGMIRIVLWGDQTDKLKELEKEMVVKIQFAYVKDNQGRKEIHLRDNSNIMLNPPDEVVGEVKKRTYTRKYIHELQEGPDIELLANIIQIFDLKFFEVCPHCNKRTKLAEQGFNCGTHGVIEPAFSYVSNAVLDDGTGNIRSVFFSNQLQQLLEKKHEEILEMKDALQEFEGLKRKLLGKMVKVSGRVVKNNMFDRIEFISQRVEANPDPVEELQRTTDKPQEVSVENS